MRVSLWFAFLVVLQLLHPAGALAQPAADPMDATVFITVSVEGPNAQGVVEKVPVTTGTGFIINESGWVVTAAHLLDFAKPPNSRVIVEGAIRSRSNPLRKLGRPPLTLKEVDVTMFTLPSDTGALYPYLCIEMPPGLTVGRSVVAFGFPFGGNNARREGQISSTPTEDGLVLMSGGLAEGMSGGPVMADEGVIGIITKGTGQNAFDYFTPVNLALIHFQTASAHFKGVNCEPPAPDLPEFVERAYPIDETNDTHDHTLTETTLEYSVTREANPGYRIIEANLSQGSATRVSDISTSISADEKSVTLRFKLTAGPRVDQYRGWLHGTLTLKMQRL